MSSLLFKSYLELVRFDLLMATGNFSRLYRRVQALEVTPANYDPHTVSQISESVDLACIWYWKQVFCLQRSAAMVCLLKRAGVPARLVIGVRQMPFKAHAWVEVGSRVISDKSNTRCQYAVLDRC